MNNFKKDMSKLATDEVELAYEDLAMEIAPDQFISASSGFTTNFSTDAGEITEDAQQMSASSTVEHNDIKFESVGVEIGRRLEYISGRSDNNIATSTVAGKFNGDSPQPQGSLANNVNLNLSIDAELSITDLPQIPDNSDLEQNVKDDAIDLAEEPVRDLNQMSRFITADNADASGEHSIEPTVSIGEPETHDFDTPQLIVITGFEENVTGSISVDVIAVIEETVEDLHHMSPFITPNIADVTGEHSINLTATEEEPGNSDGDISQLIVVSGHEENITGGISVDVIDFAEESVRDLNQMSRFITSDYDDVSGEHSINQTVVIREPESRDVDTPELIIITGLEENVTDGISVDVIVVAEESVGDLNQMSGFTTPDTADVYDEHSINPNATEEEPGNSDGDISQLIVVSGHEENITGGLSAAIDLAEEVVGDLNQLLADISLDNVDTSGEHSIDSTTMVDVPTSSDVDTPHLIGVFGQEENVTDGLSDVIDLAEEVFGDLNQLLVDISLDNVDAFGEHSIDSTTVVEVPTNSDVDTPQLIDFSGHEENVTDGLSNVIDLTEEFVGDLTHFIADISLDNVDASGEHSLISTTVVEIPIPTNSDVDTPHLIGVYGQEDNDTVGFSDVIDLAEEVFSDWNQLLADISFVNVNVSGEHSIDSTTVVEVPTNSDVDTSHLIGVSGHEENVTGGLSADVIDLADEVVGDLNQMPADIPFDNVDASGEHSTNPTAVVEESVNVAAGTFANASLFLDQQILRQLRRSWEIINDGDPETFIGEWRIRFANNPHAYQIRVDALMAVATLLRAGISVVIGQFAPAIIDERFPDIRPVQLTEEEVERVSPCAVCLENFEVSIPVRQLPCLHSFHARCILEWLRVRLTCPCCRRAIREGNDGSNAENNNNDGQASGSSAPHQ